MEIDNRILFGHKNEEILPIATTWMNLVGIVLSEISQTEKDKYYMISLRVRIYKKKKKQIHCRKQIRFLATKGRDEGSRIGGRWLKCTNFQF